MGSSFRLATGCSRNRRVARRFFGEGGQSFVGAEKVRAPRIRVNWRVRFIDSLCVHRIDRSAELLWVAIEARNAALAAKVVIFPAVRVFDPLLHLEGVLHHADELTVADMESG